MGTRFLCPLQVHGFNRLPASMPDTQSRPIIHPQILNVIETLLKFKKAVVICSGSLQCCSGVNKGKNK